MLNGMLLKPGVLECHVLFICRAIREIVHSKFLYVYIYIYIYISIVTCQMTRMFCLKTRFRRQLVKLIDFSLQMADPKISNDDKQLIELKLVSLIHVIAIRKLSFVLNISTGNWMI